MVLIGLLSSGYFLNDGWLDEPQTPEKDSLVVEETETTSEFREEGRLDIVILVEPKGSRKFFAILQNTFSVALISRFNCYKQKIHCADPPDDLPIVFASLLI